MKIGLVQINNSFSGQYYFPYSVGLFQAYLSKYSKKELKFSLPVFTRENIDESISLLSENDVVCFSLYVWNEKISLKIAEELKRINPKIIIIFGGPQVPNNPEKFLKQNMFIDFTVHGEGEATLLDLIDFDFNYDILGFSYRKNNDIITNPNRPRINDLATIPSPYLSDTFDELMDKYNKTKWIACWETNRGCPNGCAFCVWGKSAQNKIYQFGMERLLQEIEWFSEKKIDFVFCCDANFGIFARDLDIANFVSNIKRKNGFPIALSVQNTKNITESSYQTQKILSDSGLNKGVTLSVQSVDEKTLKNIGRANIPTGSFKILQERFTKDKIDTYTDIILALPGETYDSCLNGINEIIVNGQHNRIQFNNLSLLVNSKMENPEYQKRFGMETVITKIVNFHGEIPKSTEILEEQELVIATSSLPRQDWVKIRSICWMAALIHFNKTLQIPIILLNKLAGAKYKDIFSLFMSVDTKTFPIIAEIRDFFIYKAKDIQNGGVEYCYKKEFLNIFWPADEFILIKLILENKFDIFYNEALDLLLSVTPCVYKDLIIESTSLNKNLFHRPYVKDNTEFNSNYNILHLYREAKEGSELLLEKKQKKYIIYSSEGYYDNIEDYLREVIWWGNKNGSYLYKSDDS